jgi:hypothetical protein
MFEPEKYKKVADFADEFLDQLMAVEITVDGELKNLKENFARALRVRGQFDNPLDVLHHAKDLPELMFKFGEGKAYADQVLADAETDLGLWFESHRQTVLEKLTRDIDAIETESRGSEKGKKIASALKKSPVAEDIERAIISLNKPEWEEKTANIRKLRRTATSLKNVLDGIGAWVKLSQPYLNLLNTCINKGLTDASPYRKTS